MKISELVVGELYKIKYRTKNKAYVTESSELRFTEVVDNFITSERSAEYKNSLFVYLGNKTIKVKKRIDRNKTGVYNYRPHYMMCVNTGEILKIKSYYIQALFTKPKK